MYNHFHQKKIITEFLSLKNITADVEFISSNFTKINRSTTGTLEYTSLSSIEIVFKLVPVGLPEFQISYHVFLRNFFRSVFSLFGLSKKRKKFSENRINKYFDFYFPRRVAKTEIKNELQLLFSQPANKIYKQFIEKKLKGDLIYDMFSLTYSTAEIPDNEKKMKQLKEHLLSILEWIELFKTIKPSPTLSVKRIGKLMTSKLANEIKFDYQQDKFSGLTYPTLLHQFIYTISNPFWEDKNYTSKPVLDWLKEPSKLKYLSEEEIKSVFTYFIRQERFWKTMLEKRYVQYILANPFFNN